MRVLFGDSGDWENRTLMNPNQALLCCAGIFSLLSHVMEVILLVFQWSLRC
jgi:hypothetical protein